MTSPFFQRDEFYLAGLEMDVHELLIDLFILYSTANHILIYNRWRVQQELLIFILLSLLSREPHLKGIILQSLASSRGNT